MDTCCSDKPSLLLADDDITFCHVLERALLARGFAVEVAHDAASALRLIEDNVPEFAIIDLRLPDMSGLKLVRRLKSADENAKVVVLTGYGSIATAIESIKLGATHYLTKPVGADQIVSAFDNEEPDEDIEPASRPLSVDRLEWEYIQRVLSGHDGNISATARALNMHRRTLQRKLGKHPPRP